MRLSLIFIIHSNAGIFWHECGFRANLAAQFLMNPANQTIPTPEKQASTSATGRGRLMLLFGILAIILVFRGKILFEIELWRNVRADELTEEFVDRAMALPEGRFRRAIAQLWGAGKFLHRQEALTFVGFKLSNTRAASLGEYEPYLVEALADADSSLREMALNILVKTTGRNAVPHLLAELKDPDHELRVVAMRHLRNLGVTNALPAIADQLDEENPRLVCEAANWLQRMTGIDHGMRSKWVSRRVLTGAEESSLNQSNYVRARAAALAWWKTNAAEWAEVAVPGLSESKAADLVSLADYGLKKADQSAFDLTTLGDRPVLIYFFTTWKSAAAMEAADVNQFHEQMAGKATVLGVSLDAVPDEHNENQLSIVLKQQDDHGHEHHDHGHHHHHHDAGGDYEMAYPTQEIIKVTEEKIAKLGYQFPVVYDVSGRLMNRLNGSEVPVFAMLDSERRIVRRFAGPRRLQTLLSMAKLAGAKVD